MHALQQSLERPVAAAVHAAEAAKCCCALLWCVQVANAIFRMGGAAIMCSNKPCFWRTAK